MNRNYLVTYGFGRKLSELPQLDKEIKSVTENIKELENSENELREILLDRDKRTDQDVMSWLSDQVKKIKSDKEYQNNELEQLKELREELLDNSGLNAIRETVKEFAGKFDTLTRVEQRNQIEKIFNKITILPDNRLELDIVSFDSTFVLSSVTFENESSDSEKNGGSEGT